jgi:hypothetical protein
MVKLVGIALSAIVGAWCFRTLGEYLILDFKGQAIFLIGGTFLGVGIGTMFFGLFAPPIKTAIAEKVRASVIIALSSINAILSYVLFMSVTGGNQALSILGGFASLVAPAIVIGYAIEIFGRLWK